MSGEIATAAVLDSGHPGDTQHCFETATTGQATPVHMLGRKRAVLVEKQSKDAPAECCEQPANVFEMPLDLQQRSSHKQSTGYLSTYWSHNSNGAELPTSSIIKGTVFAGCDDACAPHLPSSLLQNGTSTRAQVADVRNDRAEDATGGLSLKRSASTQPNLMKQNSKVPALSSTQDNDSLHRANDFR